jgi:urease accessory protein
LSRRRVLTGILLVATLVPREAYAHSDLAALGGFYGGLLHPLVVPAELMAVLAVGLLIGAGGRATCRAGLMAFAGGVALGLVAARFLGLSVDVTTSLPLGVALIAGLAVASGIRVPMALAACVALAAGAATGIDAAPDDGPITSLVVAGVATALGSSVLVLLTAMLVLDRERQWQRIAVRIAGSWIAAFAILYFAWLLRA